jgi:nitrogen fixation protein FixH
MNKRARWWPFFVIALLVGGAGANVALMVIATRDPSFAVEPDYYQKALRWDDAMAQERENAALGWSVEAGVDSATRSGSTRIVLRVSDRDGAPVEDATVRVTAFHNARASQIVAATLAPTRGGRYSAPLPLDRPGLWELRVRVEQGDRIFTQTIARDVPRMP